MTHQSWMACAFVLLTSIPSTAAVPKVVGILGDPERIQFIGNEKIESRDLRAALGFDLEFLVAAHPDAPLAQLLPLLELRLADGYRHFGFADVTAKATYVEQRNGIVATIEEGQRYLSSDIEIAGARKLPVAKLKALMVSTAPDLAAEQKKQEKTPNYGPPAPAKPIWVKGKPASFLPGYWKAKHETMQKLLQSLGYHDVQFDMSPRPESNGTATLVVTIADEGPCARLGEIEVIGLQRNSAEDVISYLNLPKQAVMDSDLKQRIEQKLRDAARFLEFKVEFITPPFGEADSILRITLLEYDEAPLLSETFTPEEAVLIKLANWLNNFESTDNDFELKLRGPPLKVEPEDDPPAGTLLVEFNLTVSHRKQGSLIHFKLKEHLERDLVELWAQLTPDLVSIYSPRHKLRFETRNVRQCVMGAMHWTAQRPGPHGEISKFTFGTGIRSNLEGKLPPFILQMIVDPVAAVREAKRNDDQIQIQDGTLSIDGPSQRVAVDAASGQLKQADVSIGPVSQLVINCKPGIYDEQTKQFDKQIQGTRLVRADDAPISNFLSFLATIIPEPAGDSKNAAVAGLVQSVLKRGALSAFDHLLVEAIRDRDEQFSIPFFPDPKKKLPPAGWTVMILPAARSLVPDTSWAWTISREFVFVQNQRGQYSQRAVVNLLESPETGPIASLTASYLFGMLNPVLKTKFAERGLTRLQREHFQYDYEPFLNNGSALGKVMLATAQTLQELDEPEIQTLVDNLPLNDQDRAELGRVLKIFAARKSAPPENVMREGLDEAWESLIAPRIKALLNTLAN
ncbi:MAG: hypothetical protein U0941_27940 [Planctomycetaceae bacterium]